MKSFPPPLKKRLKQVQHRASSLAHTTGETLSYSMNRLMDRRICLGVTGLSGSGKTTLINSLLHQLRHYPDAALAAFSPALQGRLLGVNISPLGQIPLFPNEAGLDALTRGHWPEATRHESGCLVAVSYTH